MDAAHVDDGEDQQHSQAQLQGVWLQGGHGGDERAHAGRDAHGGGEDVVDHQGGRGQQARALAQVLAGHGVGAAAVRIGVDGLPVAEVDDGQQDHDRRAHRDDVFDAHQAQRDEQRERGLRAVRGGAEGVQAEDGDAGDGADVLGALLAGSQRAAEEQIQYVCR